MTLSRTLSESRLILIIGLVQFINILDFMMVMPMGPDFARGLGIPMHLAGYVGGSYTFAAAIIGFISALFLDNYQRRIVLLVSLGGLIGATLLAMCAWNFSSIMAARVLAGLFGGPLSAVTLAIVADQIPAERRGRAMGKIMGAFSAASVLGVPFGLELSHRFSWQAPFLSCGILGALVWFYAYRVLHLPPRVFTHTSPSVQASAIMGLLSSPVVCASYGIMACSMMAGFMIIPNIAAHVQFNMGFPRADLGLLYLFGGFMSFFSMRFAGKLADSISATWTATVFSVLLALTIVLWLVWWQHGIPVILLFTLFMIALSGRNVTAQALSSKVPPPHLRATYNSIQSSVMHIASSLGAFTSSIILHEDANGHILGTELVGALAITFSLAVPFLFAFVERRVSGTPRVS